jgi:hypothetical protein
MKVIGKRISILKKDNLLSIVILPTGDKRKLGFLFLWLLAWSICGMIVLASYFQLKDANAKLYLIVYLSFWAYFEFNIARTFLWKRFGKEKLWIKEGILHYQREVNQKGKIKEFNLDLISRFRIVELSNAKFADTFNQSFWVKGGERLEFDSQSQLIRLGMQLSDEEARVILNEVNGFISKS